MRFKQLHCLSFITTVFPLLTFCGSASSTVLEGEKNADGSFKKWHRIEVVF